MIIIHKQLPPPITRIVRRIYLYFIKYTPHQTTQVNRKNDRGQGLRRPAQGGQRSQRTLEAGPYSPLLSLP